MKELSIIIVNYNAADYVTKCFNSLLQSGSTPTSWEFIVVDNHSNEHDRAFINSLGSTYPNLTIQTILNDHNVGFAKANNQAIHSATGEFVLILNPDTIVSVNAIRTVLNYLKLHHAAGVATCKIELPDGTLDDACHRGFPTPWNAFCHFSGISKLFPGSMFFNGYHLGYRSMDTVHPIDACSGAFMMIRATLGSRLHWFDEDYFWYGEDLDFCYRVRENNDQIVFIPTVSIVHYKGVTSGIKKHSKAITTATRLTRQRATDARFNVMEIFYNKHYRKKYPLLVRLLVLIGIRWLKFLVN